MGFQNWMFNKMQYFKKNIELVYVGNILHVVQKGKQNTKLVWFGYYKTKYQLIALHTCIMEVANWYKSYKKTFFGHNKSTYFWWIHQTFTPFSNLQVKWICHNGLESLLTFKTLASSFMNYWQSHLCNGFVYCRTWIYNPWTT